ncbi:MAG: WD40 repeat domain-containing protein [Christensenellaceae bacterium]|nr:WD40 repeat domain-containing protein [Christensenellaceae bacterium]
MKINDIFVVNATNEQDERIALELKRQLRTFRLSGASKRIIKSKLGEVRDWSSDSKAEGFLVVICSPATPEDSTVNAAIEHYISSGMRKSILALLCEGEPTDSFPEALRFEHLADGSIVEHEPLAADIRGNGELAWRIKLRTERMRLLAPVYGVAFDDLRQRSRRRTAKIAIGVGSVALSAGLAFALFASSRTSTIKQQNEQLNISYAQTEQSEREALESRNAALSEQSLQYAAQAESVLNSGDTQLAMMLCLEALPKDMSAPDRPYSKRADEVLASALETMLAKGYVPTTCGNMAPLIAEFNEQSTARIPVFNPKDSIVIDGVKFQRGFFGGADPVSGICVYSVKYVPGQEREFVSYVHFPNDPTNDYYLDLSELDNDAIYKQHYPGDGRMIGVSGEGIYEWDLYTGKLTTTYVDGIKKLTMDLNSSIISNDGKYIVYFEYTAFHVIDTETRQYLYRFCDDITKKNTLMAMHHDLWSCDGKTLMALSNRREISIYDLATGERICLIAPRGRTVEYSSISSDGKYVAVGGATDGIVRVYEIETGTPAYTVDLAVLKKHSDITFAGEYDETTGHYGMERILLSTGAAPFNYMFTFNEEQGEVPADTQGRIELALKLLDERTFTKYEREDYHIN